ncbi:MAG: hypothetical protein WC612_01335 [Bdellovibrionales bacterium]|jgi:hypothetical protein
MTGPTLYHRLFSGAAALMVASVLAFCFMVLGQTEIFAATPSTHYHDTQNRWSKDVAQSKMTVAQAEELMKMNGLVSAIDANGGGYVKELKAMAIHEADGRLSAVNEGSLAYCAFQIYHTNIPSYAQSAGMSEKAYIQSLLTDPNTCAKAGYSVLSGLIASSGYEGGICRYGGQITEYKETGSCSVVRELKIIIGLLDGTLTQEVVTDKKSTDYGNVIIKDGSGEIVTTLNCQDRSRSLALALRKANDAYITTAFEAAEDEAVRLTERDSGRGGQSHDFAPAGSWLFEKGTPLKEVRGKIFDTYCLKVYFDYFNALRAMVTHGQLIESLIIVEVVDKLMNLACEYAIDVATQFIDGMLNKFCLAIPSLNIGLTISGGGGGSCNGVSLGNLLAVGYGQLDASAVEKGLVSWPKGVGLPPVSGMSTGRPDTPPLLLDLRRQ